MTQVYRQIRAMGTRLDIVLPGLETDLGEQILDLAGQEVERIEGRLSIFDSDSDISRINRTSAGIKTGMDDELYGIFKEIVSFSRVTGGYFDITVKPVIDYIRENGAGAGLPGSVREKTGMHLLQLNDNSITLLEDGVEIDLGGYGKGYAIKRIAGILTDHHVQSAFISFGESLVLGFGLHPHGGQWKVVIPSDVGELTGGHRFGLNNESLSSSGNSLNNQKKFRNSGHIIDPVTLTMRNEPALVSVKAKDPVTAEVYSTAVFSAGRESFREKIGGLEDVEVFWTG